MNAAEKKAFALRMKKAREAKRKAKRPAPVTARSRAAAGTSRKPAKKRRRNPGEQAAAAALYESFHGRPSQSATEHEQRLSYRSEFAELGRLIELRVKIYGEPKPVPLMEFGACQVTCTPDGTTIYFLGGNQKIDLSMLGIESDKDYVELGECTHIAYLTRKGFHNFEPIQYEHKFGEEDGIRPLLAYDRLNKALFLLGGNYRVRPEGIVN